ncbi:MAG: phosphopantothenoylcysteine synthase [Spirochaetaceae bacterium]|nr:phosphopantothenoylcysteine synthase [Spirochaetaceae bacterium]
MVTSGGTREKIDEARCITNWSTGVLGSLICDALAGLDDCDKIFYVRATGAARPLSGKAEIIQVSDTSSTVDALTNVLVNNEVAGIVHAMAVSDYRVKSIKTGGGAELERGKKISSAENELILFLEPAPKIISIFPELAPRALLVGFKLLCDAPKVELIDAAYNLLQKNHCAFVVANDKKFITETEHRAYLVDKDKSYIEFETKGEIARGIAAKLNGLLNAGRA